MIPASWQARRPSAAYCEFELSPPAGPSRIFLTGIFRTTLGFVRATVLPGLGFGFVPPPLATSRPAPPVGVSLTNADGSP